MSGLLLESPVGPLWLTAQDGALTGCWFVEGRFPPRLPADPPRRADDPVLADAARWLDKTVFPFPADGEFPETVPGVGHVPLPEEGCRQYHWQLNGSYGSS